MTRTLVVTLEHEDEQQLTAAENRIHDGLRWLHPAVAYTIKPRVRCLCGRTTRDGNDLGGVFTCCADCAAYGKR